MYNLRDNLIDAIFNSLKIDNNMFNKQIIKDKIEHIQDSQLQDFYSKLFDNSHQFLNGLDRVSKVAEVFKPMKKEDYAVIKANELILLVKAMNDSIYQEHIKTGVRFDDLLQAASFPKVSSEDIAVLNKIRPYYELKSLIAGINQYQTSSDTLNAFKDALKSKSVDLEMIENIKSKLRIKR